MATPNYNALSKVSGGLLLPPHDYEAYTYVGSTNNVNTVTAYAGGSGGVTVGTLTFTYVGAGAANDDNVASVTLGLPTANG